MRCGACGCRELEMKSAKGKRFSYKSHERVLLLVDVDLMSCTNCPNVILRNGDCKRLDNAIEETLKIMEIDNT